MATAAQIAANRANAQKSTGPKSIEGKQRSSMNALRHGLTASTVVLNHEEEAGYQEVRDGLYMQYKPATLQECMLVDQLASAWWRTLRARQWETDMMNLQVDGLKHQYRHRRKTHTKESDRQALAIVLTIEPHEDFKTFFRYDATIERQFYRALNMLERIQKERRQAEQNEQRSLKESTEIGFVSQNGKTPQMRPKVATASAPLAVSRTVGAEDNAPQLVLFPTGERLNHVAAERSA